MAKQELALAPQGLDMAERLKLERPVSWEYEALPVQGTCRLCGDAVRLTLHLSSFDATPPDVLKVEAWLAEYVRAPLVVEQLALDAARRWTCVATATGRTDTHGTLTAKAFP